MKSKKHLLASFLFAALCLGLTQFAFAFQDEDYTLATVPSLRYVGANENTHTVQMDTNNPQYTNVYLEVSDNRQDFSEYISWQPLSFFDNNRFSIALEDGQSIYFRIKAKNESGFETMYSEILRVDNKPTKPVPYQQEQTTDTITIYLPELEPSINYWVVREDIGIPEEVTRTPYADNTVQPAREYTYIFWADNNGVESDENTITLWTKPEMPSLRAENVFYNELVFTVDLKDNPRDIEIIVDTDEEFELNGNEIRLINLLPDTEHEVKVRLKSKNNEYTEWITAVQVTDEKPRSSRMQVPVGYEVFLKEAKTSIDAIEYRVDGESNSGTAWLEIKTGDTKFNIKANVADQTKNLTRSFVRFDGLDDNKTYDVKLTASNDDYTYSETIQITTPNRTPPKVERVYYDEEIGELILEVESIKGLKK